MYLTASKMYFSLKVDICFQSWTCLPRVSCNHFISEISDAINDRSIVLMKHLFFFQLELFVFYGLK